VQMQSARKNLEAGRTELRALYKPETGAAKKDQRRGSSSGEGPKKEKDEENFILENNVTAEMTQGRREKRGIRGGTGNRAQA